MPSLEERLAMREEKRKVREERRRAKRRGEVMKEGESEGGKDALDLKVKSGEKSVQEVKGDAEVQSRSTETKEESAVSEGQEATQEVEGKEEVTGEEEVPKSKSWWRL